MKKEKIKLKAVGPPTLEEDERSLLRRSKSLNYTRNAEAFYGEEIPMKEVELSDIEDSSDSNQNNSCLIEQLRMSNYTFQKLLIIEKMLLTITLTSIFLLIMNEEINPNSLYAKQIVLISISISTAILICANILRDLLQFQLSVERRKIYPPFYYSRPVFISYLLYSNHYEILFETFIMILHPNYLFESMNNSSFTIIRAVQPPTYDIYSYNQILSILMLLRSYIIFRSLINSTDYSSPRSERLCSQNNFEWSFLYSVKCLLNEEPLKSVGLAFFVTMSIMGLALKIAEGSIQTTIFSTYENCFWCIFITMSTVGYGEIYPITLPGRIIVFTAAFIGVVLTSQLIVSLSAYLTMNPNESRSHIILQRLETVEMQKEDAAAALASAVELSNLLNADPLQNEDIIPIFHELKRKIDSVKEKQRQIKSMVNDNNLSEEMDRMFVIQQDYLKEIYRNQVLIRSNLYELTRKQKCQKSVIKNNFTMEVAEMIKNR